MKQFSIEKNFFCMNSFNSLALTTFFQIYFHYYCQWYINPRGNTSSQNQEHFFYGERCTYKNFCFIIYFILSFSFCFLYFVFDIYIKWFLHSNKTWLSECFPLWSRHELFLLEHSLFCFTNSIFLENYQFWLSLSSLLLWLFSLLLLLSLFWSLLVLLFHF